MSTTMDDTVKVKVCKVTLLIVDHDKCGEEEIQTIIENQRYPNYCINPNVMAFEEREIEWTDEHPLNNLQTMKETFEKLFADTK